MLQRLTELRKSRKWSLQETADRLGIAKSTYAGYESGYREPPLQSLVQIADLFETTIDEILNGGQQKLPEIDVMQLLDADKPVLFLDNIALSHEELRDFIAFTLLKRGVTHRYKKEKVPQP